LVAFKVIITGNVELIGERCFHKCGFLKEVFVFSEIVSMMIPSTFEILEEKCFNDCEFLNDFLFDDNCNLTPIEKKAFLTSGLDSYDIPSKVDFIRNSRAI
jgi:hypothetical protein